MKIARGRNRQRYFFVIVIVLAALDCSAAARPQNPPRYEGMKGYQEFIGATSADAIPTITLKLVPDALFDERDYSIGNESSLQTLRQPASGITRRIYHDQKFAEQIDENGGVARDRGRHLRDLITQESLITGRIAFFQAVIESPEKATLNVPDGWPVDLIFSPGGRLWKAVIHSEPDVYFAPLAYSRAGRTKVLTDWLVDTQRYHAESVVVGPSEIAVPSNSRPSWKWVAPQGIWRHAFTPLGGRPVVPITVNGVSADCVVDTAAGGLFFPVALANRAGVPREGPAALNRLTGSSSASYGRADIVVGPVELRHAVVITGNAVGDTPVCGYDFLSAFVVDIAHDVLTVAARPSAPQSCTVDCAEIDTWLHAAMVPMTVGSARVNEGSLDTGFNGSLLIDDSVRPGLSPPRCGGGQQHLPETLTFGALTILAVPTCYAPLARSQYRAVLGAKILLSKHLTLDLGNNQVRLR